VARSRAGLGCLLALTSPFWLGPAAGLAVLAVFALATPVLIPVVALTHPVQFAANGLPWLALLAVAPLLAALCVSNPKAARSLPRGPDGRVPRPVRRALLIRRLRQAMALLTVPGSASLLPLLLMPTAPDLIAALDGHAKAQLPVIAVLLAMFAAAVAALAAVIAGCRWWDRRFPPVGEAVSEEVIRETIAEARAGLRALDQHRAEVDRMLRRLQEQQARVASEHQFRQMKQTHRESHQCGTLQRDYFQTVLSTCYTMRWLTAGANATAAHRIIPLRDPRTGRRQRLNGSARASLRAAGDELAQVRQNMEHRADDALLRVHYLNMGTARLRDQIRDECGPQGWNWYQGRAGTRLEQPA
jgi:hypothetical protein